MTKHDDPIEQLRDIDPVDGDALASSWSTSQAKQGLFQEITQMPTATTSPPDRRRRGVPRRAMLVAATIGALSVATLAGAAGLFSSTSTGVGCQLPDDTIAIERATTGDPAVDCAAVWQRETGESPPELTAYANSDGGIVVVPATDDVPDDWQALPAGVSLDPAVVELESALDDIADGLRSDCHLPASAERVVERELDRLGLNGWTTRAERGDADGVETCTYYYLDPANRQVALIPLDGIVRPADDPHTEFARHLADQLDANCHDLAAAEATTRSLGSDAGLQAPGQLTIKTATDPDADCTRADVTVGGTVQVTLRGPEA